MKIRERATQLVIERQAPDAAELVGARTHEYVDRDVPSIVDQLSSLPVQDLRNMTTGHQLADRDFLIRHLTPLVEAGAVTLKVAADASE